MSSLDQGAEMVLELQGGVFATDVPSGVDSDTPPGALARHGTANATVSR